jgi:hypothetical protein
MKQTVAPLSKTDLDKQRYVLWRLRTAGVFTFCDDLYEDTHKNSTKKTTYDSFLAMPTNIRSIILVSTLNFFSPGSLI